MRQERMKGMIRFKIMMNQLFKIINHFKKVKANQVNNKVDSWVGILLQILKIFQKEIIFLILSN